MSGQDIFVLVYFLFLAAFPFIAWAVSKLDYTSNKTTQESNMATRVQDINNLGALVTVQVEKDGETKDWMFRHTYEVHHGLEWHRFDMIRPGEDVHSLRTSYHAIFSDDPDDATGERDRIGAAALATLTADIRGDLEARGRAYGELSKAIESLIQATRHHS